MQSDNQQEQQTPFKPDVVPGGKTPLLPKYVIIIIVWAVVLAAIFFLFISPRDNNTDTSPNPIAWKKNPENPGNYIGHIAIVRGTVYLDDCAVTASHGGSSDSMDLEVLAGDSQLIVGDMTLDFIDLEPFGELGINDIFIVYGGQTGDVVRIVHKPTSGSIPGSVLP